MGDLLVRTGGLADERKALRAGMRLCKRSVIHVMESGVATSNRRRQRRQARRGRTGDRGATDVVVEGVEGGRCG